MKHGPKYVIGALIIVALIALKVYNRTPRWREGLKDSQSVPLGKASIQFFSLKKEGRLRLTVTEKDERPLLVYWLTKEDSDSLHGGDLNVAEVTRLISDQILCQAGNLPAPKEFELKSGEYSVYFEAIPVEGDTRTEPYQIDYLIEEYR